MSSNLHITRQNYEEYFLLYVDNELSASGRMAVEAFIALHPDLREELELLQTTIIDAESDSILNKGFLMADSMKVNAIDESMLLYLDDELKGEEKARVKKLIETDPEFQLQYNLLQETRLEKETIVYPYKAELYRKAESRPVVYWMRIAAAIIVVVALGLIYLLNGNGSDEPLVADVKPVQKTSVQPDEQQVAIVKEEEPVKKVEEGSPVRSRVTPANVITQPSGAPQEQIAYEPVSAQSTQETTSTTVTEPVVVTPTNATAQQNINTEVVTTTPVTTYNPVDATQHITPKDYPVAEDQKSGSVRGLLRKATRFIEKRTGVNPVNEDDELLIGALAIKLK